MLPGSQQHLPPAARCRAARRPAAPAAARAQQRGLADPGGAEDAHQRRLRQPRDQLGDDPLAAAEELGVGSSRTSASPLNGHSTGAAGLVRAPRSSAASWRRIIRSSSCSARLRLEPELLAQQLTRLPVDPERLGLAAGAIEREHQLRAQPLRGGAPQRSAPRARRPARRWRPSASSASIRSISASRRSSSSRFGLGLHEVDGGESASGGPRHRLAPRAGARRGAGSPRASTA